MRPGNRRRGFTLVEALVALVVAGLLMPPLARALGGAWTATRTPMEVVSAIALARDVAAGASVPQNARAQGFSADRTVSPLTVLVLPSAVAPAPGGTGPGQKGDPAPLRPDQTPAGLKLAPFAGLGGPPPGAPAGGGPAALLLRSVTVAVHAPSGRRIVLVGVRLDDASR